MNVDHEELTSAEEAQLVAQLRRLAVEIEEALEIGRDAARPVTLDQQSVGRLSRMDAIQQQHMAQASRRNQRTRLRQVLAALQAAEAGDYGFCRRCEEPIGFARLQAQPESPFCLACQRKSD